MPLPNLKPPHRRRFTSTPEGSGDRDAAVKKLKVAGIEVAIVLAVMPIDMTIDKVHQAAVLIDAGKYYEGSQELRLAQANERFDMIGNMGTPKE